MTWQLTPIADAREQAYCSNADIKNMLSEIDTELNLSEEVLTGAAYTASRQVESICRQVFYEVTVADKIVKSLGNKVLLERPVVRIESMYYLSGNDWVSMSQGYTSDYYIDNAKTGEVVVNVAGDRFKVTYIKGSSSTPGAIKWATAQLGAYLIAVNKQFNTQGDVQQKARKDVIESLKESAMETLKPYILKKRIGVSYI